MRKTLTLQNPVMINGVEMAALDYDTNAITASLFAQADAQKKQAAGLKNVAITPAVEFDYALHLYLGFAAIVAASDNAIAFFDCERIHGADLVEVMSIGRNFILKSEASTENSSEEPSETTAEPSTQAQLN